MNEEQKMIMQEDDYDYLTAYSKIPYSLISKELEGKESNLLAELQQICKYYKIYKKGADFLTEGSKGDYIPSQVRYKQSAVLVNKQARFMFAEAPDIVIEPKGDLGKATQETKDNITVLNDLVKTILKENKFEELLIKAAKDCFIGKRIAGLVNFNEEDGVTITFLPSTQFLYETKPGNPNIITKFVCFITIDDNLHLKDKRIFKKKYTLEKDTVYLEEIIYDGNGSFIEEITPKTSILLPKIPVAIFVNDGLTGDKNGVSEIEETDDCESLFSRLANADVDAERKSMNPIVYTVDMDNRSTANLSSSAGSYWDLSSNQNLPESRPTTGILEPSMKYSSPLDMTLNRTKTMMYEQVDVPNISVESMKGVITSGKALKILYWPLMVRCKEKFKMWGSQLRSMIEFIIEGSRLYPNCVKAYTEDSISPVAYEVQVIINFPLPEDEIEEKQIDLAEVESQTMSRKTYMKKWRELTDDEVEEELSQIALERQILEDSSFEKAGSLEDTIEENNTNLLEEERKVGFDIE